MNIAARRLTLLLMLAAIAAGCARIPAKSPAEQRAEATRPKYNLAGYPPAVRDGYIDGCESAKGSRYGRKDAKRFAEDQQYNMGWNDGFGICKKK